MTSAIEVSVGDIVTAGTEAIVNAANSELWMGGGVAGAIKSAAGEEVEGEAMAQGPIRPGEAVITSAGRLPAPTRWVVHAATMGPDLQTSANCIRSATRNALRVAAAAGVSSLALPSLGTGVGGFPIERAAKLMVQAAIDAQAAGQAPARIVFVVRDEAVAQIFRAAIDGT